MLLSGVPQRLAAEHGYAARQFGEGDGSQGGGDDDLVQLRSAVAVFRAERPRGRQSRKKNDRYEIFFSHAPSAGTNRIRFNGFAGGRAFTRPASQALKATPALLRD